DSVCDEYGEICGFESSRLPETTGEKGSLNIRGVFQELELGFGRSFFRREEHESFVSSGVWASERTDGRGVTAWFGLKHAGRHTGAACSSYGGYAGRQNAGSLHAHQCRDGRE